MKKVPTTLEDLARDIPAAPPRNDAERHLHAVLAGTAPEAPEIRHADFAGNDTKALRAYVAEEVRLHGGLSDTVLLMLVEMDRDDAAHKAATRILSAAPRLSNRRLI